ncbi:MAG: amidohydrolase family protein [Woeseia sp.]
MIHSITQSFKIATAVCLLIVTTANAQWSVPASREVIIRGGWLFDGISDKRRQNTGIVIREGNFAAVDAGLQEQILTAAAVIDLSEQETILPGMFDLHAHYNFDLVDRGRAEEVVYNGIIFLANGVTSTWSAGEYYPERVIAQRDLIDAGESTGPRLFASGPYFGGFRCEYSVETAADDCVAWPNDITEEEIREEVDKWAEQGVISIKIKQATPGEAKVLIEQAHRRGMTTTGHLANYHGEYDVHPRDAILMGLDRVEHRITLASGQRESADLGQMIDLLLKYQVYFDANLQMYGGINLRNKIGPDMVWTNESRFFTPYARALLEKRGPPPPESDEADFAQRMHELRKLFDMGGEGLLVVGTDEPVYTPLLPGFAYHRELLAMTYAGLPPVSVLKAATINGAKALGVGDRLGSIEAGKLADLLVVNGNPLADIRAARDVRLVIKSGRIYESEALLKSAEGMIGPTGPDDHADWELRIRPLRTQ